MAMMPYEPDMTDMEMEPGYEQTGEMVPQEMVPDPMMEMMPDPQMGQMIPPVGGYTPATYEMTRHRFPARPPMPSAGYTPASYIAHRPGPPQRPHRPGIPPGYAPATYIPQPQPHPVPQAFGFQTAMGEAILHELLLRLGVAGPGVPAGPWPGAWSWMRLHPAFFMRYLPWFPWMLSPMLTTVPPMFGAPGPEHEGRPPMAMPVYLSNSGSVGTPGMPVRVMSLVANGTGTLTLYNGRDTSGQVRAVVTAPLQFPIPQGWFFPQGLFVAFAGPSNATFGIT